MAPVAVTWALMATASILTSMVGTAPLAVKFLAHCSSFENGGAVVEASSICNFNNISNFEIRDSMLREGEQFATAFFDTAQKIKTAKTLDDLGAEYVRLPIYAMRVYNLGT